MKLLGIYSGKDPAKSVMGWNTVLQLEELFEPVVSFLAEEFNIGSTLSPADNGAYGNDNDFDQPMVIEMLGPWIFQ